MVVVDAFIEVLRSARRAGSGQHCTLTTLALPLAHDIAGAVLHTMSYSTSPIPPMESGKLETS